MPGLEIKEYLSRIGIRRINELDTALVEAFGREEGEGHIFWAHWCVPPTCWPAFLPEGATLHSSR